MNATQTWYREPWPWLLIAGPALVIVASGITFWLAYSSSDPLVVDDYYKAGKAINMTFQRDVQARTLRLSAKLKIDGRKLSLFLQSDSGEPLPPVLRLLITHATQRAKDHALLLTASQSGEYATALTTIVPGRYHLTLEDVAQTWRLTANWSASEGNRELALHAE